MDLDGILIMHSESGLPLFAQLDQKIDEVLFSGLLTAIKSFINELSLGGLSSFSTDEKNFYLTGREKITTCLISNKQLEFKDVYALSLQIGSQFENKFENEISNQIDVSYFKSFEKDLQNILDKDRDIPFIIRVAEFVKKEFGDNISYNPKLKNNNGKYITIDLLVDNGEKISGFKNKVATKFHKSFSKETIFIKSVDGVAGRAEVKQFLDLSQTFGGRFSGSSDPEVYNFFPRKMVVVAKEFSPTVFEDLKTLKKHNNKSFIPASHILPTASAHSAPEPMHCYVECWQWQNSGYPKLIFS